MVGAKVEFADFPIGAVPGSVMRVLQAGGVKVFAYDIGNGGGAGWNEPEGLLMGPHAADTVRTAARSVMLAGARGLHLDNVHDIGEGQLEVLMDAQVVAARELGLEPALHLKNATRTYFRILERRTDLRQYVKVAVVEHLTSDAAAAEGIAKLNIPVFGVEFAKTALGSPTATFDAVTSFVDANSWVSGIWSLPTEEAYEGRQGVLVTPERVCVMAKERRDLWAP